ncbi:MAG TPA: YggS family pyridoxal phosphate-dependent enzyme [Burkholderiales bacterium]|nr:YggS family pyridoxal phosphate-dependent enzyme [Burkholderiales bacterium]
MTIIAFQLQAVRSRIERAAREAHRTASEIALLAVSKTFPASYIEEAHAAGQRLFGESYAQEGVKKVMALGGLPLEWHFIGPIQSNKTRLIAEHFDWVHSVDREKIAERLDAARPPDRPPLQVCIEVNVSGEATKHGVAPEALADLARAVSGLPRLRLRGLMAIPEATPDVQAQRRQFGRVRVLRDELAAAGIPLDTLSMGMSDDLEAAIAEGSTLVRVGTALFGQRERIQP